MKFGIIGAGWYGCHIAHYLQKKGFTDIIIFDKSNDFFSGASSKNQNRLHLGYHYPRSKNTIEECEKGFSKFNCVYSEFLNTVPNNLYLIHKKSKISFEEYIQLFPNLKQQIEELKNVLDFEISNVNEKIFVVSEMFINNNKAKTYFTKQLSCFFKSSDTIEFDISTSTINSISFDYIFNCTNNQYVPIPLTIQPIYELFCSFIYKIDFKEVSAITIMDGEFFSIYPYNIEEKLYTITHVKYGVLEKNSTHNFSIEDTIIEERRELIESEIFETIPHLKNIVSYKRYFVSNKTKYDYETDDRSIRIFNKDRYYSFSGGKISGIFEMEPILDSLVQ